MPHPCIPKISRARLEERRPPAADTYLRSQGPHSSQSAWGLRMRGPLSSVPVPCGGVDRISPALVIQILGRRV